MQGNIYLEYNALSQHVFAKHCYVVSIQSSQDYYCGHPVLNLFRCKYYM
jgi:hypothetical protein